MKHATVGSFITAILTVVPLAAFAAQPINKSPAKTPIDISAAKTLLRQKMAVRPPVLQMDASLASCTAYATLVKNANSTFSGCMNPDTPPAGSPMDKFNKYSNYQLGQYCGNMTMHDCVDRVQKEQGGYCTSIVAPIKAKAEKEKLQCGQARKECVQANTSLKALEKAKADLEAQKKKLEADLAKANSDLAARNTALNKAKLEADKQCKSGKAMPKGMSR